MDKNVKDLLGTSIGGMAGLGAIGAMGTIPGMPANTVGATAATGINLAQLGSITKIGLNILPKKDKKSKNSVIHKDACSCNYCKMKKSKYIKYFY